MEPGSFILSIIASIIANILPQIVECAIGSKTGKIFTEGEKNLVRRAEMRIKVKEITEKIRSDDPEPLYTFFRNYLKESGLSGEINDDLSEALADLCKELRKNIIEETGDLSTLISGFENEILRFELGSIRKNLRALQEELNVLSKYAIDIIAQRPWHNGIPIKQVISEPFEESLIDLSDPILLYGPPNVGKTCWALRQAWHWMQEQAQYSLAFYLNANIDNPDIIINLAKHVPFQTNVLYVIDDIHYASRHFVEWVDSVQDVIDNSQMNSVRVLWIARDASVANELVMENGHRPTPYEYNVERVVELFTKRLQQHNYELWQRVITAFETGLDPDIAIKLRNWQPPEPSNIQSKYEEFVNWLHGQVHYHLRQEFTDKNEKLKDEAYNAYLMLLPFGSINYPVEEEFLQELGVSATATTESLVRYGLARITYEKYHGDRIVLTEHPFQIRRMLYALENLSERVRARDWIKRKYPNCSVNLTISEAIFTYYLSNQRSVKEQDSLINQFKDRAKWSDVQESLAQGLRFLLNCVD